MSDMRFDRRRLLVVGGSGVMATVLAACGSGSGNGSSGGAATAAAATLDPATEQGTVTVFDWAGYEIPAFWNQYEKGPYGKSNPLKFTFLENDQQALAKVAAGYTPDMAHPCIAYAKD